MAAELCFKAHGWPQGNAVSAGKAGGVMRLFIWPCTQACELSISLAGIQPMTMASVRSA